MHRLAVALLAAAFLFQPPWASASNAPLSQPKVENPPSEIVAPLTDIVDATVKTMTDADPQNFVGLTVGVVRGDANVLRFYGTIQKGTAQLPTKDSIFEVGSVSKVFTSSLFARLMENTVGKTSVVALSDTLSTYLPPGTFTKPSPDRGLITLQQLVTHHSGLPKKVEAQPYEALCNAVFQVPDQGSSSCADPENCMSDPSKYLYSNAAFILLGRALEYRLGSTYEKLFAEYIATPLGTQHMKGREEIDLDPAEVALMVMGHHGTPAKPSTVRMQGWPFGNPAGGMTASGDDMLKFLKWNLGKAGSTLDSILPVVQAPLATGARDGTQVAMGWDMYPKPGTGPGTPLPASYNYSKNGSSSTMTSFIAFNRDDDVGVFVLSNSLNFSATQVGAKLLEAIQ